jgi:hypothetical protein
VFAFAIDVDAAGRLVLATEENEACEIFTELRDEYGMGDGAN